MNIGGAFGWIGERAYNERMNEEYYEQLNEEENGYERLSGEGHEYLYEEQ